MFHLRTVIAILAIPALISAAGSPARAQEAEPAAEEATPTQPGTLSLPFLKPVPLTLILGEIQSQLGVTVTARGKAGEAKVAIAGENMALPQVLDQISDAANLVWRETPGGYEIWDAETFNAEVKPTLAQQKVFVPEHITAVQFHTALTKSNILTKEIGTAAVDERTNQVIVNDLPARLALAEDLLALLDVPQYTRVFFIRYGDTVEIAKKIEQFKSEEGQIEVDPLSHRIIVRDVLTNIQRMESLIELLDTRQPRRVYHLNSIGVEAAQADALIEKLKALVTPEAIMHYDKMRGLLFLQDIPEVHDDVESYLRIFDRPIDQVLIQAEVLDVNLDNALSLGMEWTASEDLPGAVADGLVPIFGTPTGTGKYGYQNYRREFPLVSGGASGLLGQYISSHVKMELTALLEDQNTRLLLRPRLLVKNGEEVLIESGREDPVANEQRSTENSVVTYSQQIVKSGLLVELQPIISPTGLVEITVSIENSVPQRVEVSSTQTGIRKDKDSVQTTLIVPDGETRVISGLIRRREAESVTGIPILVKIPFIGPLLFGRKSDDTELRNLVFFITPTIVREKAKGDVLAYDLDEVEAEGGWLEPMRTYPDPETMRRQSIDTILGLEGYTSPTQTLGSPERPRFDAPLPSSYEAPSTGTLTSDGATTTGEDSARALEKMLQPTAE